jgi:hypothetical protein
MENEIKTKALWISLPSSRADKFIGVLDRAQQGLSKIVYLERPEREREVGPCLNISFSNPWFHIREAEPSRHAPIVLLQGSTWKPCS